MTRVLLCVLAFATTLPAISIATDYERVGQDAFSFTLGQSPLPKGFLSGHGAKRQSPLPPALLLGTTEPQASLPIGGFNALTDNGAVPPDTNGAVGPNHVVTVINGGAAPGISFKVQDRGGGQIEATDMYSFWGSVAGCLTDPRVIYDPLSNRWVISEMSWNCTSSMKSSYLLIAVSATGDPRPSAPWYKTQYRYDPTDQCGIDFPNLGLNSQWVVVTADILTATPGASCFGTQIFAFDKAALYSGSGVQPQRLFDVSPTRAVPALTLDPAAPMYLVNGLIGRATQGDQLRITRLDGTAPAFISFVSFATRPESTQFNRFTNPQLGGTLEASTQSAVRAVLRNGSLWVVHSIGMPEYGASGPYRNSIQWWQVTPATGAIVQFGRVDDPNGFWNYDFPSIAVNRAGHVMLGFSQFSTGTYAAAAYATHLPTDPPSSMRPPYPYYPGSAIYTKGRWGDYSATVVDPKNDLDMWTLQQYAYGQDQWGLWWAAVSPTADLVDHYYSAILGRNADGAGRNFWLGEAERLASLGVDRREVFRLMGKQFFFSPEYIQRGRDTTGYVTDLYNAFFNRAPDPSGLANWVSQIDGQQLNRDVVLVDFERIDEFSVFMTTMFGSSTQRAEVSLVMDAYRGALARLPDNGGYQSWINSLRAAQCSNSVATTARQMIDAFFTSSEYVNRSRDNGQYVADLYDVFIPRAPETSGFNSWVTQLNQGVSRTAVREGFYGSPEWNTRIATITSAGCIQ